MLGADGRVVESGRDRVRDLHLPGLALQEVGLVAVQHADVPRRERRRVLARLETVARRPRPRSSSPCRSPRKGWKSPMALLPPPTQAISTSGSRPVACLIWRARLLTDDRLKVAHDHRIRMRARRPSR